MGRIIADYLYQVRADAPKQTFKKHMFELSCQNLRQTEKFRASGQFYDSSGYDSSRIFSPGKPDCNSN